MWGLSDGIFSSAILAIVFFYVALCCLAAAVTARWWSGIAVSPIPSLLFLGDPIFGGIFGFGSLMIGLPTAIATAVVFRQVAEPPDMLLEGSARVGGLVAAVMATLMAVMILVASY